MKVLTFNIHFCEGKDGQNDPQRIADTVRDADIVALQEVEVNWDKSGNVDQAKVIAGHLPNHFWAWGPGVDLLKEPRDAGKPNEAKRRQFGNMILSKYPILTSRNILLPKKGAVDVLQFQRSALEVILDTPSGPLRVYSTHLCNLSNDRRVEQLKFLTSIARGAVAEGPMFCGRHRDPSWSSEPDSPEIPRNAIILGDLNFTPQEKEYPIIAGEYNPYGFGRLTFYDGFADAWVAAGHTDDSVPGAVTEPDAMTHFAAGDPNRGMRIDYCFISPELVSRVVSAQVLVTDTSDHYPVVVELDD